MNCVWSVITSVRHVQGRAPVARPVELTEVRRRGVHVRRGFMMMACRRHVLHANTRARHAPTPRRVPPVMRLGLFGN